MFTSEAPLTEHDSTTQLLSSIVAANYKGVRQTGRRTEGPLTQWLRCWPVTWDTAVQWKAVNSFRPASLNLGLWVLHYALPFALPTLIWSSGCAVGKKEEITQMSTTQREQRNAVGEENGKKGSRER